MAVEKKYAKAALDRHIDGRDFYSVGLMEEALLLGEQMAVGLIIQFSGVDAAKYDAILKEAGLKGKKAVWPAGIISHAAGPTADGWCVVDVWSSRAQFDKFLSKRLKPAFDRAGGMPEPHVTTFQIHNKYHRV